MNFIEYYLGQNQDRRIIYYLGARCECSSLVNTLNMCVLEDFYLVLEDDFYKEFCLKELSSKVGKATFDSIHFVSLDETKEILSRDSHFTIVYDSAFVLSTLVELSKYKPNRIIGCFDKEFSTFDLWEKLRDYADEIVLIK